MTREEAKHRLLNIERCTPIHTKEDVRDFEALDMAIKALEKEPSGDVISRQELLEDLYKRDYTKFTHRDFVALVQYQDTVQQEPKTGHWIPVSERLPEDKTYVLTTIKVPNRQAHARSGWYEGGYFHNDNGDTWKATDREVKAWMPLPEPYKAESEDI